jgi:lysophospholipase-3
LATRKSCFLLCVVVFVLFSTLAICSPLGKGENSVLYDKKNLPPVVLVPGDGGSQFEAKLDKPSSPHVWCEKKTDGWFPLWLSLELLAPYILDCTVDNLRLVYDKNTRTTINSPGVQTRQPGFGNTSSVEWLDPSQFSATSYYYHIVESLIKLGYTRNKNIRGAPYDFRKAPNEMQPYINNLANLVKETYEINGNTRVVLLAHSMGNLYTLYMLNHQSQAWKDKYVQSHISLSGPWAGAVKTLKIMASGDNLGVFIVNPLSARPEQRAMPSSAWLMPSDDFWSANETLVISPKRNYTVKDYKQYFSDINYMTGYYMHEDTVDLTKKLTPPGVEVHCLHGINVSTPAGFHYTDKSWPDNQPDVINGNGDGTVNQRSLYACLRWEKQQKQKVFHQEYTGIDHMMILNDQFVLDYITSYIQKVAGLSTKKHEKSQS